MVKNSLSLTNFVFVDLSSMQSMGNNSAKTKLSKVTITPTFKKLHRKLNEDLQVLHWT